MGEQDIGAFVTLGIWGVVLGASIRRLGLARTLWLVGLLFFVAIRVMLGFLRAFRTD
jgi:hypothetical protein